MKRETVLGIALALFAGCGSLAGGSAAGGLHFYAAPLTSARAGHLREVEVTVDHPRHELIGALELWIHADVNGDGRVEPGEEVGHHEAQLASPTVAYRTGRMMVPHDVSVLHLRCVVEVVDDRGGRRTVEHEWSVERE